MDNNKLNREYAEKNLKNEEFFHSSPYGIAQNSGNIGVSSVALTMAERKAIEEKRKYVQKYSNSMLIGAAHGVIRLKKYEPGMHVSRDLSTSENSGEKARTVSPHATSPEEVIGIGGRFKDKKGQDSGFASIKSTPVRTSAPSRAASFYSNLKPKFK